MDKILTFLFLAGMGIYIMLYPKLSSSGGTIDLSYMNINIFLGFILISLGILFLKSKKNKNDKSSNGGTALTPGDSQSMDCSTGGGGDGC